MEPNKRLALKYCLLLLFSILCGVFQIANTVFKFENQKPTLEHYINDSGTLWPPSITFCGSNSYDGSWTDTEIFQSFDKEHQIFEHWPDKDVFDHWKESTFEFHEILKSITDLNDQDDCNNVTSFKFQSNETKCGMKWKEVNSIYNGRCYTIEFMKNVTQENPLEIILKFHTDEGDNKPGLPIVYIHPQHHELSIPLNVWKTDPYVIELKSNKEHEITITNTKMEKHSPESTNCNVDLSYKEYFNCTADKMGEKIKACNQWKGHCSHIKPDLACQPNQCKVQNQPILCSNSSQCQGQQPGGNEIDSSNSINLDDCCEKIKVSLEGHQEHAEKIGLYHKESNNGNVKWVKNLHGYGECTRENKCGENEGPCIYHYECEGNLRCGQNNCQNSDKNCCYDPNHVSLNTMKKKDNEPRHLIDSKSNSFSINNPGSCGNLQNKGDNYCDDDNNNQACGWDGGDCCGNNINKQYCSECECLDPQHGSGNYGSGDYSCGDHGFGDHVFGNSGSEYHDFGSHVSISFKNTSEKSGRFYIKKHMGGTMFPGIRSKIIPTNSRCPDDSAIEWEFYKIDQNGNCDSKSTSDVKLECIGSNTVTPNSQRSQQTQNSCDLFNFCTIPQANSFTQGDFDEDYCTNGLDAACVVEIIQENRKYFTEKIEKEDSDMMCPKPCHTINYSYSKMRNSLPSSKQETWLRLTMSSTEVEMTEEFDRMDLHDMLASIGGSIVLFTGFSFLEFCVDFIEICGKCFNGKRDKKRVANSGVSQTSTISEDSISMDTISEEED